MDGVTITIIIAIIGCMVGVAGWVRKTTHDAGDFLGSISKLEAKINHLEGQVIDLKIEIKSLKGLVYQTIDTATIAKNSSIAAHDRLDALDVINAEQCRKQNLGKKE